MGLGGSSQLYATEKMIKLFEDASILRVFDSEAKKMVPDFFWDYVKRPQNVG